MAASSILLGQQFRAVADRARFQPLNGSALTAASAAQAEISIVASSSFG
jgi:hypothetical protein